MDGSGGSIQPYRPKGDEVLARISDGDLPPGRVTVVNTTAEPEPVFTADQLDRLRAWLRDHHRDGGFGCPSSTDE